jgi:hypothetical protein
MSIKDVHSDIISVATRAANSKLFYVVCYFYSPISESISRRVGYFEDVCEAEKFSLMVRDFYSSTKFKYFVLSDCLDAIDGGLFS